MKRVSIAIIALVVVLLAAGTVPAGENGKPLSSDEWRKKGVEAFNAKDYQNAVVYFKKTLELNPKDAKAFYDLGLISYSKGEYLEAIQYCGVAIELAPSEPKYYRCRGPAYGKISDGHPANGILSMVDFRTAGDLGDKKAGEAFQTLKNLYILAAKDGNKEAQEILQGLKISW
jgi:tetratricopeptide (TPR) repeat protein